MTATGSFTVTRSDWPFSISVLPGMTCHDSGELSKDASVFVSESARRGKEPKGAREIANETTTINPNEITEANREAKIVGLETMCFQF